MRPEQEQGRRKGFREEALVLATLILAFVVLSALSILFLQSERGRNTLLAEYQTDRDASALLEISRSSAFSFPANGSAGPSALEPSGTSASSRLQLPKGILGFALYKGSGVLLSGRGQVPANVTPANGASLTVNERFTFDSRDGTLTLLRPLGVFPGGVGRTLGRMPGGPGLMGFMFGPPAGAGAPGNGYGPDSRYGAPGGSYHLPGAGYGVAGSRGLGGPGEGYGAPAAPGPSASGGAYPPQGGGYNSPGLMRGMMGGAAPQISPDVGARNFPAFLYLRKDVRGYFAAQTALLIAMAALPAAFAVGFLLIGRLYRKNRRYRERLAAQANLVHLGEIARTLSHEIKNPLGSIKLQTAILKKLLTGDPPRELGLIEEETDQLNRLVERIGEFLRDPVGKPIPIGVREFVGNLTARFSWRIESRAPSDDDYFVLFDPDRLRSVLENLLKNAVESGGAEKPVTIELAGNRTQVEIRILDRGPGLPRGDGEAIFDPFFTTKTKGSGIGLAISKRFVEAAGGVLTLRNAREGGAEAHVSLKRFYPSGPAGAAA